MTLFHCNKNLAPKLDVLCLSNMPKISKPFLKIVVQLFYFTHIIFHNCILRYINVGYIKFDKRDDSNEFCLSLL